MDPDRNAMLLRNGPVGIECRIRRRVAGVLGCHLSERIQSLFAKQSIQLLRLHEFGRIIDADPLQDAVGCSRVPRLDGSDRRPETMPSTTFCCFMISSDRVMCSSAVFGDI